ncbi:MAG TPA: FAD-dependent oxidoreductase [Solirubrobacterales bacterium]|nr:FAD-dependent oxidoreductase [Solirubrobacterales bacterium]
MPNQRADNESVWIGTAAEQPSFPQLDRDVEAEVAVIGGGIVGITTALLLAEAGADVVLLESGRLARGVTANTTAKVTSQHGLIYAELRSKFGADGARAYGQANEAALAWIADRVEADGIECDFRRQANYVYVSEGSGRSRLEREVEAALDAGLPASLVDTTPLPYPVEAAVRFDDQAEFHPRRYLLALVARLQELGCRIHEDSRAVGIDGHAPHTVRTAHGTVSADAVVVATHYPFLDRSLAFARVHPERSYAIVCRIADEPPMGMHISAGAESPTRSVRAVPVGGEELLLVGGEGHKTGEGGDTERRYAALEEFARQHWRVESVEYRWSTQDNVTIDHVPYVGRVTPRTDRLLMATGFAKWGMTGGTAAALLLADTILGRENRWAGLFDPFRLKPLAGGPKLVKENARVAGHFIGDRVVERGGRRLEDLAPGEGAIVNHDGEKVAGHRRDDGTLVAVSTRCTHLGCQVKWNTAERSWDCPCHGSRFTPEGAILQGPAVDPLELKAEELQSG